ncbi:MAG: ABC transporter permease [Gammaproteobacteria bacterium]|nr:MAG: ABC transporter permease [Gammaproteobacteria bacterium]
MRHLIAAGLLIGLGLLGGCSGGQDLPAGVLRIGNGTEPQDLDPHVTTGLPEYRIQLALFEGLVAKDPRTLEPVPAVARHWTVSDDGLRYTFELRPEARWSNGDAVTADDFVFSFRRLLTPALGGEYAYMLYPIVNARAYHLGQIDDFAAVGVRAPDPHTLVIELEHPVPYFLQLLDHHSAYPVHRPTIEAFGAQARRGTAWTRPGNLVGNGPFVLREWSVNRRIVVEPNPHYWNAGAVHLPAIAFLPVEDANTQERMFRGGQLDIVLGGLNPDKIEYYRRERPQALRVSPAYATYYYEFNTRRPPFDDPRVRRALAMAIDREAIVERVTRGGQRPAAALTPPDPYGYRPPEALRFDPEAARALLAEAGYPDGRGFPPFEVLYNTAEMHQRIAVAIQQMWKRHLNIEARLTNMEWKVYLAARNDGEFDVARAGWVGDFLDPINFLELLSGYSGNNHSGWSDPRFDALLEQSNRERDRARRYALLQEAERLAMEAMPVIPIYYYSNVQLVSERVQGWHDNLLDYHPYLGVRLDRAAD